MPSEKILEKKKKEVASVAEKLKSACAGVIVEYKGINVADDTKLRRELREANVSYTVVKNTILSRAAKEAKLEGLDPVLEGTTALAVSEDDYVAAARILCILQRIISFLRLNQVLLMVKLLKVAKL